MRKNSLLVMVLAVCTALNAGCAKKEMVRSEEAVSQGQTDANSTPGASYDGGNAQREAVADDRAMVEQPGDNSEALTSLNPLNSIYFDFDSYLLSKEARDVLDSNAKWLRNNQKTKVQIEGHCDERGSDAYNLALGESRAKSVLQYLQSLGIDAERLTAISYGEEKPAVEGHDESFWSKNRRAELIIQR